ncbi:MAG: hypothetical protein ACRD0Z_09435 [Acidimicrobiales bacterium]
MPELDERIRALYDTATPVTLDEIAGRPAPTRRVGRASHARLALLAAVSLVVVGTAVSFAVAGHSPGRVNPAGSRVRAVGSTVPSVQPPVEIRIELDQTQVAGGTTIKGEALVYNNTPEHMLVEQCAVDGWLWVGLANSAVPFEPASSVVACRPTVELAPGLNTFPITVSTSWDHCTEGGPHAGTPRDPACLAGGLPPLPAGEYHTVVRTIGIPKGTRVGQPIDVTVTNGS